MNCHNFETSSKCTHANFLDRGWNIYEDKVLATLKGESLNGSHRVVNYHTGDISRDLGYAVSLIVDVYHLERLIDTHEHDYSPDEFLTCPMKGYSVSILSFCLLFYLF